MPARPRASRSTPSTALRIGSLPVFPSPWSGDHGAVVSIGFPSSDAGRGSPPLPADSRSGHATPSQPEPAPQKRNQATGRYKPVAFTRNAAVPKHSAVDLLERCVRLAHATRRTSRFPHAFTYFRSVATDGECFPVASARSRRAMAGGCVPIRLATCA